MKISIDGDVADIADYVMRYADGTNWNDYDNGAVEIAQNTADNIAEILGRLMSTLADKSILDAQDIVNIADKYNVGEYEAKFAVEGTGQNDSLGD